MDIGKIEIVPIRQAFPHEAHNFTVWLEDNIDALSERLGLDLNVLEREKSVGSFNVDLFCEDANGSNVIIENQLERTDHDHLGKLLTYMVNLDAKTAIWVATEIRPEHERVVDWLNEMTGDNMSFYAVKVEAVRIGDSPYAPLFTSLAQPDEQTRQIGKEKKEIAGIQRERYQFWSGLLAKVDNNSRFVNISPSQYHWIGAGAGKSGLSFNFTIGNRYANVELYIDHDKDTGEKNKQIFDALYVQKAQIESEFGDSLDWRRLDEKRASRILYSMEDASLKALDDWDNIQRRMIDAMYRLEKSLRHRLASIGV